MSNISQFFAGRRKQNRRIIHGGVGVTTVTWLVPPGVTEVEVHCWGAGGSGAASPANTGARAGGGGGYVTHVFPVTPSDRLLITAGAAPGGTSSVSVPTQSPGSPISATGGGIGTAGGGGAGGSGVYTIAPGISTARTFSASGGSGLYGGGAAGSPFGTGGAGGWGGGGIGGPGSPGGAGGGSLGGATINPEGGLGKNGYRTTNPIIAPAVAGAAENLSGNDDWFYVDEILGGGGEYGLSAPGHGGAGGGGAWGLAPLQTAGHGGILGGGGAGTFQAPSGVFNGGGAGFGGLAGGGGIGQNPGVVNGGGGLVILYW
jgi:hypothetical protein